ncbi:hypothetical protein [Paenibacillus sp. EKM211P]|uniref:hypothetical protein n=1 Tax=Paenibacillus sp. EKM211P TaxID=1683679 RepID=UPI001627E8B3|nr:hypothetical protein [Paenibacillus sp. EKM211P]KAF6584977.1 hypothetical protein G9G57_07395 [Paenibacillus sp. EKM211P]
MSERTVDLIRKDVQSAKNEAKKNILLPVREVEDVLALVDSLQQQVKKLSEYKVSSKQFAELYDKAIAVVRQNEINKKKADDNYRALLEDTVQLRDQLAERDAVIRRLTYKLEEARKALGRE